MLPDKLYYCHYQSPVGRLLLAGTNDALHLISFPEGKGTRQVQPGWQQNEKPFAHAIAELQQYFAGERQVFSIPFELHGTQFRKKVWLALAEIPFGQIITYGEMAKRVGNPKASRAVGAANGANNLPILLPCHRVIGANRKLTGFGGGLPTKQFLLRLENKNVQFTEDQLQLL